MTTPNNPGAESDPQPSGEPSQPVPESAESPSLSKPSSPTPPSSAAPSPGTGWADPAGSQQPATGQPDNDQWRSLADQQWAQPATEAAPTQYPPGGAYNYPPTPGAGPTAPGGGYPGYPGYPPPAPQQPYAQQPYPHPGYPQQPYPVPGYSQSAPYAAQQSGTQVLSIIGFVCAAVALLFCPILFGPAGIILGIIGHTKGEPLGKWAAVTAGFTMILGFIIAFIAYAA